MGAIQLYNNETFFSNSFRRRLQNSTERTVDSVSTCILDLFIQNYKDKIDECFVDTTKFMPHAPGPFTNNNRQLYTGEDSVNKDYNLTIDQNVHDYVCQYYNLDTKDAEKRQATIQAIANKEPKVQHLFGKDRTVYGAYNGQMSFHPVFGKHNLGIEIPDNGAIAKLCEVVGAPCSNTRNTLLVQEYGRKRPGQKAEGVAKDDPRERVLVNYAIEDGDGHKTGYYNQNGDYIDDNGNHIGDYTTFFQNAIYANSYPSGHSAYIWGIAVILMHVMPDKAPAIMKAANEFAISRCITRYHWTSDTINGRVIGSTMVPVLFGTSNINLDNLINEAKEEYEKLKSGQPIEPVQPTDTVNTSLSYVVGGYGSCHVDAGEKQLCHCCNKECYKDRTPAITVNQRVNFTIEGAGVTTYEGATSGVWEANTLYYLICPAVAEGEEKIATITMRNENGVRVLKYKLSRQGTHDDGPEN